MRRGLPLVLVAALFVTLTSSACGGGSNAAEGIKLDGSPRVPDVEGVATNITRKAITVGGKTYEFASTLQSFSTYTLELEPVVSRKGQLVHVGLDGDLAVWVAGIGEPIGDPPTVVYAGQLVKLDAGRAVMRDGTTFPTGKDSVVEAKSGSVQVRLDPADGLIIDLRPT